MRKPRLRIFDLSLNVFTYLSTLISALSLGFIFYFVFTNGLGLMSLELFTGNYHARNYIAAFDEAWTPSQEFNMPNFSDDDNVFPVPRYGIALKQDVDLAGDGVIKVFYVHPDSPFNAMSSLEVGMDFIDMDAGNIMDRVSYVDHPTSLSRAGAQQFAAEMNDPDREIYQVFFTDLGGGIRGSIITTLYLIVMTLVIAIPFGVLTAIYFNEFAPVNWITKTMRNFIETLTGVPSIIYGLLGISVFVPLTVFLTPAVNSNLIAGALTLTVIVLPIIIRTTEESLKTVPQDHRNASLALGANVTQTTFKVVLPQAFTGILTATFLTIGRIIGESAALIFVLGAAIKDRVDIFEASTSLAVHIWSMMTDEPANIALSSTIALLILMIVLILNLSIKFSVFFFSKRGKA
jgi:phosphate transport system permease protein